MLLITLLRMYPERVIVSDIVSVVRTTPVNTGRRFSRWRTRNVDIISSFSVLSSHPARPPPPPSWVICFQKSRPFGGVTMFLRTMVALAKSILRVVKVRSQKFFNHHLVYVFNSFRTVKEPFARQERGSISLCLPVNNEASLGGQKIGPYSEPTLIYCYILNGGARLTFLPTTFDQPNRWRTAAHDRPDVSLESQYFDIDGSLQPRVQRVQAFPFR